MPMELFVRQLIANCAMALYLSQSSWFNATYALR
jgi:hypothetical protein